MIAAITTATPSTPIRRPPAPSTIGASADRSASSSPRRRRRSCSRHGRRHPRPRRSSTSAPAPGRAALLLAHGRRAKSPASTRPSRCWRWRASARRGGRPRRSPSSSATRTRSTFADRSFDVAVSLRVLMHSPRWREALSELCRVSSRRVIFDYPSSRSAARLQSVSRRDLPRGSARGPSRIGCSRTATSPPRSPPAASASGSVHRQFVLPIALHKAIGSRKLTTTVEAVLERAGLLRLFGSPVTVVAERCLTSSPARPDSRAATSPATSSGRGRQVRALVRDAARARPSSSAAGIELVVGRHPRSGRRSAARPPASTSSTTSPPSTGRRASRRTPTVQVNAVAAGAIVEAAAAAGVKRVVHCSTVGVHGDVEHPPANEDAPLEARRRVPGDQARRRTTGARRRPANGDSGDDRAADRHLRAWRSPAPEAVRRRGARPLSDAGQRQDLLPPHLHRRPGRGLPAVRRASRRPPTGPTFSRAGK